MILTFGLQIASIMVISAYIYLNTEHLFYGFISNKLTWCDLFTSEKSFICYSMNNIPITLEWWDIVYIKIFYLYSKLF